MQIITELMLNSATTLNGGYTDAQLKYAVKLLGLRISKGWKKAFIGKKISDDEWLTFVNLVSKGKRQALKKHRSRPKIINPMPTIHNDYWRPEPRDIPGPKSKNSKNQGRNKARRERLRLVSDKEFCSSREWLQLRARALEKYGCKCMICGQSPKEHGVVIEVTPIKPRQDYSVRQLDINNVQLICEGCLQGRGSKYETDWRPSI